MRIGLVASPFIPVPPTRYGGTELFVANLAQGLKRLGADVVVYTNGAATVNTEIRWTYEGSEWPLVSEFDGLTKDLDHFSWAIADAERDCDIIQINSALAVTYSRLSRRPFVCTLHHPYVESLTRLYARYPEVFYAAISRHQAHSHASLSPRPIHHGLDLAQYRLQESKKPYVCFLGRICPIKGTHNAIEIAKQAGIPLKIAGEVQPIFREYFETMIRPHLDGKNVEYVGEANLAEKNELLGNATAMLFPIEWNEPFGLVMIEAMACGTPVIALPGGAVTEVVKNGVSGRICASVKEAAQAIQRDTYKPLAVRSWVEKNFSVESMTTQYYRYFLDILDQVSPDEKLSEEVSAA